MILKLRFLQPIQDRFKSWESSGVTIVPVLSQPDDSWAGETGYVQVKVVCMFHFILLRCVVYLFPIYPLWTSMCLEQAAFARAKQLYAPDSTGAVLCGQKQMAEVSSKIYTSCTHVSAHF